jgi:hypothetical protein
MNKKQTNEGKIGVVKYLTDFIIRHKKSIISSMTSIITIMVIAGSTSAIEGTVEAPSILDDTSVVTAIIPDVTTTATTTTTTTMTTSLTTTSTTEDVTTTSTETTTTTTTPVVTTTVVETTSNIVTTTTQVVREYVVFKPKTHYIHKNTCRWFDNTCYEITDTENIQARKCTECNPEIEIINKYVVPEPVAPTVLEATMNPDCGYPLGSDGKPHASLLYITEAERFYLCNTVRTEYGSDWVSIYDKALVVAVVMNRLNDGGWQGKGRANTIFNVLTAPSQFAKGKADAVAYYRGNVSQSCIDAVDYYFLNQDSFPHYTSFWGDGKRNHFR